MLKKLEPQKQNKTNSNFTILGLDASTSCVGYCLIKNNIIEESGYWKIKDEADIFEKVDFIVHKLKPFNEKYKIDLIALEEPVLGFATGFSNSHTKMMLASYNEVLQYAIYKAFDKKPEKIKESKARSLYKVDKNFPLKLNHLKSIRLKKAQTLETVIDKESSFEVEKTIRGNVASTSYDVADAIVIARAFECLLKKKKKE